MKTETDLEQKQTESTKRRLGPEKLWNELFSVPSACSRPARDLSEFIGVTSCEMPSETDFEQKQTKSTKRRLGTEKLWNELFFVTFVSFCEIC
jgi:hypothetical protein